MRRRDELSQKKGENRRRGMKKVAKREKGKGMDRAKSGKIENIGRLI